MYIEVILKYVESGIVQKYIGDSHILATIEGGVL